VGSQQASYQRRVKKRGREGGVSIEEFALRNQKKGWESWLLIVPRGEARRGEEGLDSTE